MKLPVLSMKSLKLIPPFPMKSIEFPILLLNIPFSTVKSIKLLLLPIKNPFLPMKSNLRMVEVFLEPPKYKFPLSVFSFSGFHFVFGCRAKCVHK